jgi:hypothetical protein
MGSPPPLPKKSHPWRHWLAIGIVAFGLLVAEVFHTANYLELSQTAFTGGHVIGFATNRGHRFVTDALVEVNVVLTNGRLFTPFEHYIINVYARPGETFPFHTGGVSIPNFKSLRSVRIVRADFDNPDYWDKQASDREQIRIVNATVDEKNSRFFGVTGQVTASLPDVSSVETVFAFYDVSNKLCEVESWSIHPIKSEPHSPNQFTFSTSVGEFPCINPQIRAFIQYFGTSTKPVPGPLPRE